MSKKRTIVVLYLVFLSIGIFTHCHSGRKAKQGKVWLRSPELTLLAWNEDSLNTCEFALKMDSTFYYTVTEGGNMKSQLQYHGKINRRSCLDTLFLDYDKGNIPPNFCKYLVREASGSYYIQFFVNGPERMFLRKQKLGHRF